MARLGKARSRLRAGNTLAFELLTFARELLAYAKAKEKLARARMRCVSVVLEVHKAIGRQIAHIPVLALYDREIRQLKSHIGEDDRFRHEIASLEQKAYSQYQLFDEAFALCLADDARRRDNEPTVRTDELAVRIQALSAALQAIHGRIDAERRYAIKATVLAERRLKQYWTSRPDSDLS